MSRMILEKKIGQMTHIERSVASVQVMKDYFIDKHHSRIYFLKNWVI